MKLMSTLEVDGLIIGTVTSFDPYDPPKLGPSTIELFESLRRIEAGPALVDPRRLTWATTGRRSVLPGPKARQPIEVVSGFFDANDLRNAAPDRTLRLQPRGPRTKKDTELV